TEVLSEEGLAIIEHNAETILQEIGIDFKDHPRATALLRDAGCDVDGMRVRFPRGLARKLVSTCPREFTQHARNPARTVPVGGKDTVRMSEILFGEEFVRDNTVVMSLINANSPLVWDASMLGAAEVYAAANQAVIMTPFILSGAMSPVTVAGTLAQVLAEVLA